MASLALLNTAETNEFLASVNEHWNTLPEGAFAIALRGEGGEVLAITAAYSIFVAGGSWVRPGHRRQGLSKLTREALEHTLREKGAQLYVSFPSNDEEKAIFASYGGSVGTRLAQVKGL